jgi:argininosuccinate synthase
MLKEKEKKLWLTYDTEDHGNGDWFKNYEKIGEKAKEKGIREMFIIDPKDDFCLGSICWDSIFNEWYPSPETQRKGIIEWL